MPWCLLTASAEIRTLPWTPCCIEYFSCVAESCMPSEASNKQQPHKIVKCNYYLVTAEMLQMQETVFF